MTENHICPKEKCKKPWDNRHHTFVGFRTDGVPRIACGRDPNASPCEHFDGVNALWNRTMAAEQGGALAKKTAELSDALSAIARLELSDKQQKAAIGKLKQETDVAVSNATQAIKDEMKAKLDVAAADQAKTQELLTYKESRLAEAEATVVTLRGKIDEITASLMAELDRAKSAEARAEAADARVAPLEQAIVGELKGRIEELSKLCKSLGIPVPNEIDVIEVVTVHPSDETDTDIIELDQLSKPSVAKAVPPPPPAPQPIASSAPAAVAMGPSAPPPANLPDPAPAAEAPTALVCTFCDQPAVKIAKDKWALKVGDFYPEIVACRKVSNHEEAIYAVLEEDRELLESPPAHSSAVLPMFEDINPNPST